MYDLDNTQKVVELVTSYWSEADYYPYEKLRLFCFTHDNEWIGMHTLQGNKTSIPNSNPFSIFNILKERFISEGFSKLIVVHNHPINWCDKLFRLEKMWVRPSTQDIRSCVILDKLLLSHGFQLVDNIILTPRYYFSFKENFSTFNQ